MVTIRHMWLDYRTIVIMVKKNTQTISFKQEMNFLFNVQHFVVSFIPISLLPIPTLTHELCLFSHHNYYPYKMDYKMALTL